MGLAWIAYFNSLNGVFFFDDIYHLVENPKDLSNTWQSFFASPYLPGRVAVDLTFALWIKKTGGEENFDNKG